MYCASHSRNILLKGIVFYDYWTSVCLYDERADRLIRFDKPKIIEISARVSDILRQVLSSPGLEIASFEEDLALLKLELRVLDICRLEELIDGCIFLNYIVLYVRHVS